MNLRPLLGVTLPSPWDGRERLQRTPVDAELSNKRLSIIKGWMLFHIISKLEFGRNTDVIGERALCTGVTPAAGGGTLP